MNDMMLKPCPFCGSPGRVSDYQDLHSPDDRLDYIAICSSDECPASSLLFHRDTKEEAIASWNTRASHPAQEKSEPVPEGMQPSRPKPHMPVGMLGIEDFCFCNNEVSLQSISGSGSTEGYLGSVRLKIDGEFVTYVRKDAPPAEREREKSEAVAEYGEIDREFLGKLVRMEWVAWAHEQDEQKPSWLTGWDDLTEPEREVDRRIGERIYRLAIDAMYAPPAERVRVPEVFRELVEACEADFCSLGTETGEPDDSKVSYPEEKCHLTFGHIRRARKALSAAPESDS